MQHAGPGAGRSADQPADAALARQLADEAGALLLQLRTGAARDADGGVGTAELRAAGDRGAHELLAARLAELRPADAVLSEEAADDPARLTAARVWIVDPLDGTREFSEGRHDWAVHVALWERGALVAGAVALPGIGVVLGTDAPPAVPARPGAAHGAAPGSTLRAAVSRSRPDPRVLAALDHLGAEAVPMGSAGYKAAAVVRGEVDAYVHAGGQYEWDSAAPVAVAHAAGLHASRLDGSPLRYNADDPYLPDLLVCRPEVAAELLDALAGTMTTTGGTASSTSSTTLETTTAGADR